MKKNDRKARFTTPQKVLISVGLILLVLVLAVGSFAMYVRVSKDHCNTYANQLPNPGGKNDMKVTGRYYQCLSDKGLSGY